MAAREVEFRAPTEDGELVGWLRDAPAAAPKALLLHGGPGLGDYLGTLALELEGLLTTARYQQRGIPPSTLSGDRTVDTHIKDAHAVMEALGWEKPLVVGHSWGGHLAMHVAAAEPDRIGGLVIIDALGPLEDGGIEEFGAALMSGLSEAAAARVSELDAKEDITEAERRERLGLLWPNYFGDPQNAPPMPDFLMDMRSAETWDSINAHLADGTLGRGLPKVKVPALAIHGERSPMPLVQAHRMVELMPNARLVALPGIGHWAWLEQPGVVRSETERFLAEL